MPKFTAGDLVDVDIAESPAATPVHTTAAANTAVVRTYAAVAGQRHRLVALSCSFSAAAATTGLLTVEDGAGTTVFSVDVPLAVNTPFVAQLPDGGIQGSVNTALIITLAAGGAGAVGKVNTAKVTA